MGFFGNPVLVRMEGLGLLIGFYVLFCLGRNLVVNNQHMPIAGTYRYQYNKTRFDMGALEMPGKDKEIIALLKAECAKEPNVKAWAKKKGLSLTYVLDIIHGRRWAGKKILKVLGRPVEYKRRPAAKKPKADPFAKMTFEDV